jgi:WD40 repeat protein
MSITFPCTECGQKYQVGQELAGKRMKCRKCGALQPIPVPRATTAPVAPQAEFAARPPARPRPTASPRPAFDPFERDGPAPAANPYDDVYGLGDAPLKRATVAQAEDLVPPRPGRSGRPRSTVKPSDGDQFGRIAVISAGVGAGLFLSLAVVGLFTQAGAVALIGLTAVVATLLMMGGGIWAIVNAFREDVVCGILYLFLPFYPLYYLITRWSDQWRPFVTQLAGTGVLIFGLLVGFMLLAKHQTFAKDAGNQFAQVTPPNFTASPVAPPSVQPPPPVPVPPMPRVVPPQKKREQAKAPSSKPSFTPGAGSFAGGANTQDTKPAAPTTARFTPGGGFASTSPAAWDVQADPPAQPVSLDDVKDIAITIQANYDSHNVVLPTAPSPYVVIGRNHDQNESRELWDLKQKKMVARVRGKVGIEKPLALSADGAYLAGNVPFKNQVVVLDLKSNKLLGQFDFPQHKPDYIDFAGNQTLVLGFFWGGQVVIYDLTKPDQPRATIKVDRFEKEATATSPGGRYVATTSNHALHVYSTEDGREVAMEPLPKGENNWDLNGKGMAFSPDGKELVALAEAFGKFYLLLWDATNGKLMAQHGPYQREEIKQHGYEGQAVQWLPNQDGWLVYGEAMIERQSGKKVESLPFNDDLKVSARKVLNDGRVLALMGRDGKRLVAVPLKTEKIAAAMKLAREGGNPLDAALPDVKTSDIVGAKRISLPTQAVAWGAAPDPKPAAPKSVSSRTITLKTKPPEVVRVLFSDPTKPQAAVASQPDKPFGNQPPSLEGKPLILDRFDLTNGKYLGRQELAPAIDLLAFSPDGSTVLTWNYKDRDRLDAYDDAGKSIAGWRPYESESGDDRQVVWADFLDAKRVLTLGKGGTLVLWQLPECKAEYAMEMACQGTPVFSPGRKYLALFRDGAFHLIDPATGQELGETSATASNPGNNFVAAAFRHDGGELAAVVAGSLVRWDMRSGQGVAEFPSQADVKALEFCDQDHVLVNGQVLYDLNRKRVVWYYNGGTAATGSPDLLHWLVLGNPFNAGLLGSLAIPEKKVEDLVAQSENKSVPAMLKAGTKVSIQLESGNPPREADAFRRKLTDALATKLRGVGVTVADGQPVKLVARITEKPTGENLELRKIGPGFRDPGPRNFSVPIRDLDCELLIADPQGPISIAKNTMHMRQFGMFHIPPGEGDVSGFLFYQAWLGAQGWFSAVGMPSYVARGPQGVIQLPGNTDLNQLVR